MPKGEMSFDLTMKDCLAIAGPLDTLKLAQCLVVSPIEMGTVRTPCQRALNTDYSSWRKTNNQPGSCSRVGVNFTASPDLVALWSTPWNLLAARYLAWSAIIP